jgi:small nuclear ribonucleoprotein (snRNP)-like protein
MEQRSESPAQGKVEMAEEVQDTPAIAKLRALLGKELRITIYDGRIFLGNFACTDKGLNLVLTNVYEFSLKFKTDHLVENGRFVGMLMFPWRHIKSIEIHMQDAPGSESDEYM